ncbi:zf-HC2 domain-containing protein [Streptomyces sp. NPDC050844]|uniref:anti-sigma factor family protein n=1 Tax=Streptomyces sp. NPDC050844 TaxID=3155790 RepID=UPI0033FEC459
MTVSPSGSTHVELLLGAYVLGALSPDECRQVADHLAECDSCSTAHAELSDAPAFLALLTEADLAEGFGLSEGDAPGGGV